jgi:hypothetical protein
MSRTIITALLLAIVALSSSNAMRKNVDSHVLVRLYPDFAQIYRGAALKQPSKLNKVEPVERYHFFFTEKEFTQITEESLTMLHTDVIERTITFHPMPNFEVVGSRYFYRRDPKDDEAIEIELIKPEDHLFREVRRPTRYLYISSFDNLIYTKRVPVVPYYEVTFICNSSVIVDVEKRLPVLSYIDRSLQWKPRYVLDLPVLGGDKKVEMLAFADIRNDGELPITVKNIELVAGDIKLSGRPIDYVPIALSGGSYAVSGLPESDYSSGAPVTRPLGEQASGTYVFKLLLTSPLTLTPHTVKSVKFIETNVTIEPVLYYSTKFSPMNLHGKLFNAYNLTSFGIDSTKLNTIIPSGRLILREQGTFVGDITLPDLAMGETHTMIFGRDADVTYRRYVTIVKGEENKETITYNVRYVFKNLKSIRDVHIDFIESFGSLKSFEIKSISTSVDGGVPDLVSYGSDLRGSFIVPRESGEKTISYNIIVYKEPTVNMHM